MRSFCQLFTCFERIHFKLAPFFYSNLTKINSFLKNEYIKIFQVHFIFLLGLFSYIYST